jgi:hypothetical protein
VTHFDKRADFVVVGGGIAGLSCARELALGGQDVLVIAERLGGRILQSMTGANLGASYMTSDYRELRQFANRGARIWMKDVAFFDTNGRWTTVFQRRTTKRIPQLWRLYCDVRRCRVALNELRRQVKRGAEPREVMHLSPTLRDLVRMPAVDLVRGRRYEEITRIYAEPILHSTLFVELEEVNAFYFLASLFPILLPVWTGDFEATVERIKAPIGRVLEGTVTKIERRGDEYCVEFGDEVAIAKTVVLATPPGSIPVLPAGIAEEAAPPARCIPIFSLHLRGRRRPPLPVSKTVFFRPGEVVTVLWRQSDGSDIAFSHSEFPDLSSLYEEVKILDSIRWAPAIVLSGRDWRPRQLGENFFAASDYNLCGLEDSFLAGSSLGRLLAGLGRANVSGLRARTGTGS